jgi:hypothetical protein
MTGMGKSFANGNGVLSVISKNGRGAGPNDRPVGCPLNLPDGWWNDCLPAVV